PEPREETARLQRHLRRAGGGEARNLDIEGGLLTHFGGRRAAGHRRPIRRLLPALFCLIGLAAPAMAQRFGAESFTLGNGLQVVVVPKHQVPAVTQMVWYKTGAADDPRGKSGIAHFLEHLMFKGTKANPP